MAKIFLLGTGPLLEQGATVVSGQCLRTWHFAAPMLAAGHDVEIATIPIPGATTDDNPRFTTGDASYQGRRYFRFGVNAEHLVLPRLRELLSTRGPIDAVVGVNAWPAYLLARVECGLPFWGDLNGWTMAEGTSRAAVVGHDEDFGHFWRQEAVVVLTADRLSAVSARQAWALWGELAMLGRLGSGNFDEDLVSTVPNAIYPDYATLERRRGVPHFLESRMPPDSCICLWTGGFNTWTNVPLLVAALEEAMREEPRLCFVSTGGAVVGHDETTYAEFQRLAGERLPADRTVMLGWAPFDQVLELHQSAAVGLNIDGLNIETRFGARNRVTNMLGAAVPVLTTRGTEIADWIERHDAGVTVDGDSPGPLASRLLDAVRHPEEWEKRAAAGRELALREFAPANTLAPFLSWCQRPRKTQATRVGTQSAPQERLRQMMALLASSPQPFTAPMSQPAQGFRTRLCRAIRTLKGETS